MANAPIVALPMASAAGTANASTAPAAPLDLFHASRAAEYGVKSHLVAPSTSRISAATKMPTVARMTFLNVRPDLTALIGLSIFSIFSCAPWGGFHGEIPIESIFQPDAAFCSCIFVQVQREKIFATAAAGFCAPIFRSRFLECSRTVQMEITSVAAMAFQHSPCASRKKTSISRGVSRKARKARRTLADSKPAQVAPRVFWGERLPAAGGLPGK